MHLNILPFMQTNGCEVVFISLLENENDFRYPYQFIICAVSYLRVRQGSEYIEWTGFLFSRIPESLPSLHDVVLAAAANAAISVSSDHKRKQVSFFFFFKEKENKQTTGFKNWQHWVFSVHAWPLVLHDCLSCYYREVILAFWAVL